MSDELLWLGAFSGDVFFRLDTDWGFASAQKDDGERRKANAPADVGELMLWAWLILVVSLACAVLWFWIAIRLLLPVVWDAEIKPFIREMLGPRR